MDVQEAIKAASEESGVRLTKVSVALGFRRHYVHTVLYHNSVPSVDSFGMMLAACGYSLCAVKDVPDGAIVIDSFIDGTTYEERLAEIAEQDESE